MQKPLYVINILLRAGFIIIGILLLSGYFKIDDRYSQVRLMMGIVFILYGIFRLVTMFARSGPAE